MCGICNWALALPLTFDPPVDLCKKSAWQNLLLLKQAPNISASRTEKENIIFSNALENKTNALRSYCITVACLSSPPGKLALTIGRPPCTAAAAAAYARRSCERL